jgi:hypothetical protein
MARRRPPGDVSACRAIIHAWDGLTICAPYDRMLIPWRWHGGDQFMTYVARLRREPTVVPNKAMFAP